MLLISFTLHWFIVSLHFLFVYLKFLIFVWFKKLSCPNFAFIFSSFPTLFHILFPLNIEFLSCIYLFLLYFILFCDLLSVMKHGFRMVGGGNCTKKRNDHNVPFSLGGLYCCSMALLQIFYHFQKGASEKLCSVWLSRFRWLIRYRDLLSSLQKLIFPCRWHT